ncbi:MAG: hypothetical protein ACI95S_001687, partial [Dinoroseobacter sp.]
MKGQLSREYGSIKTLFAFGRIFLRNSTIWCGV